jgi:hypothetical protein
MNLGNVDGRHVEEENDSSVFTVTTESPKPGYDGLSNYVEILKSYSEINGNSKV